VFPRDQQQEGDNEAVSLRKANLLKKAKLRYLFNHHGPATAHTEYTLSLLVCCFFAGVTYPSVLSAPYFLFFMVGVFLIAYGSYSRAVSRLWPFLLIYALLHLLFTFLYQFPQISSRIVGEEPRGSGFCAHYLLNQTDPIGGEPNVGTDGDVIYSCDVASGLAGLLGLFRYTCFNAHVGYHWYYPVGYLFLVFLLYILSLLKHKSDVFQQLMGEGLKVPQSSRVIPELVCLLPLGHFHSSHANLSLSLSQTFSLILYTFL
jgi:hypothetical protein